MRRKGGLGADGEGALRAGEGGHALFWAAGDAILRHMWLNKPTALACHLFGVDMCGESVKKI